MCKSSAKVHTFVFRQALGSDTSIYVRGFIDRCRPVIFVLFFISPDILVLLFLWEVRVSRDAECLSAKDNFFFTFYVSGPSAGAHREHE